MGMSMVARMKELEAENIRLKMYVEEWFKVEITQGDHLAAGIWFNTR